MQTKEGDREEVSFLYSRVSLPKKISMAEAVGCHLCFKGLGPKKIKNNKGLGPFFQSLLALRFLNYIGLILIPKDLFTNTELVIKEEINFQSKRRKYSQTVKCEECINEGNVGWKSRDHRSVQRSGVHSHRTISRIMINLWETMKGVDTNFGTLTSVFYGFSAVTIIILLCIPIPGSPSLNLI